MPLRSADVELPPNPWLSWEYVQDHVDELVAAGKEHLLITLAAVGLAMLLAVPLGAVAKILLQRGVKAYLASSFYNRPPNPLAGANAPSSDTALTAARIDVVKGKP